MVTSSMGMLDWVHGDTSDARPVLSLRLGLEVGSVRLQNWLVSSLATGAHADHASAGGLDRLADARGESESALPAILGVTDDDGGGAGGAGESAAVALLGLNRGDDGALWHGANWHNVADGEGRLRTSVDKLAGVHAFDGDEKLSVLLVFVLVFEDHLSERSASAGVVQDVSNDSLDVSFALDVVQSPQTGWGHSLAGVSPENQTSSASLCSDNSSHG